MKIPMKSICQANYWLNIDFWTEINKILSKLPTITAFSTFIPNQIKKTSHSRRFSSLSLAPLPISSHLGSFIIWFECEKQIKFNLNHNFHALPSHSLTHSFSPNEIKSEMLQHSFYPYISLNGDESKSHVEKSLWLKSCGWELVENWWREREWMREKEANLRKSWWGKDKLKLIIVNYIFHTSIFISKESHVKKSLFHHEREMMMLVKDNQEVWIRNVLFFLLATLTHTLLIYVFFSHTWLIIVLKIRAKCCNKSNDEGLDDIKVETIFMGEGKFRGRYSKKMSFSRKI